MPVTLLLLEKYRVCHPIVTLSVVASTARTRRFERTWFRTCSWPNPVIRRGRTSQPRLAASKPLERSHVRNVGNELLTSSHHRLSLGQTRGRVRDTRDGSIGRASAATPEKGTSARLNFRLSFWNVCLISRVDMTTFHLSSADISQRAGACFRLLEAGLQVFGEKSPRGHFAPPGMEASGGRKSPVGRGSD